MKAKRNDIYARDNGRRSVELRQQRRSQKHGKPYTPKYFEYPDGHVYTAEEAEKQGFTQADARKIVPTDAAVDGGNSVKPTDKPQAPEGDQREPQPKPQPGTVVFNSAVARPRLVDGPAYFPTMRPKSKEEADAEALAKLLEPENLRQLQREAEAGGFGCPECYYTGFVVEFGELSKCKCQNLADQRKRDQEEAQARKAQLDVEAALAGGDKAVRLGIVPKSRANDDFDADIAKERILKLSEVTHAVQPRGVEEYLTALQTILAAITANTLNCSYVIGAPKCCGKTTFVMTALKRLVNADKRVVPYMSLSKLAEIQKGYFEHVKASRWAKLDGDKQGGNLAELDEDIPTCTWAEVLRADVLFAYLTTFEAAVIELPVLQNLLNERGLKGRPTIIMTENPVAMYDKSPSLKRLFWNDIQNYTDVPTVKKLTHVSTWRVYPGAVPKELIRAERGKEF